MAVKQRVQIASGLKQLIHDRLTALMLSKILRCSSGFSFLAVVLWSSVALASSYQYSRMGAKADSTAVPSAGTALMGGGKDLDEAFRWLCKKGNGGDFLILRAIGDNDYNPYVNGICKMNSVSTLVIPDTTAANDPAVVDIIRHAEAVFIAGGNQARYVNFWRGTACRMRLTRTSPGAGRSAAPALALPCWANSAMAV